MAFLFAAGITAAAVCGAGAMPAYATINDDEGATYVLVEEACGNLDSTADAYSETGNEASDALEAAGDGSSEAASDASNGSAGDTAGDVGADSGADASPAPDDGATQTPDAGSGDDASSGSGSDSADSGTGSDSSAGSDSSTGGESPAPSAPASSGTASAGNSASGSESSSNASNSGSNGADNAASSGQDAAASDTKDSSAESTTTQTETTNGGKRIVKILRRIAKEKKQQDVDDKSAEAEEEVVEIEFTIPRLVDLMAPLPEPERNFPRDVALTDGTDAFEYEAEELDYALTAEEEGTWSLGDVNLIDAEQLVSEPESDEKDGKETDGDKDADTEKDDAEKDAKDSEEDSDADDTEYEYVVEYVELADGEEIDTSGGDIIVCGQPAETVNTITTSDSGSYLDGIYLADKVSSSLVSNPADPRDYGNGYYAGQCTWWAYERRHQLGLPVASYFGNGWMWKSRAIMWGYSVSNTPTPGAIVVFAPGQAGAHSYYGHVAIVESVQPDGSIIISEMNVKGVGVVSNRTFSASTASQFSYIH